MGLVTRIFSFHGRVGRAYYWLSCVALAMCFVFSFVMLGAQANAALAMAKFKQADPGAMLGTLMFMLPLWGAMCWASFATQAKRFHDRGRTGYLVLVPVLLMAFLFYTAISMVAQGAEPQTLIGAIMPILGIMWLVNLAFFIDLGCLPGVEGPNKYGNPPGSPPSPTAPIPGRTPAPNAAVTSSLFGAQSAMDRAIAEQARQPATAPAIAPSTAPSGGSFGRRTTR